MILVSLVCFTTISPSFFICCHFFDLSSTLRKHIKYGSAFTSSYSKQSMRNLCLNMITTIGINMSFYFQKNSSFCVRYLIKSSLSALFRQRWYLIQKRSYTHRPWSKRFTIKFGYAFISSVLNHTKSAYFLRTRHLKGWVIISTLKYDEANIHSLIIWGLIIPFKQLIVLCWVMISYSSTWIVIFECELRFVGLMSLQCMTL